MSTKALTLKRQDNGIIDIVIDLPDSSVNLLKSDVIRELEQLLTEIEQDDTLKLLRIISNKPHVFIAGADISEIQTLLDNPQDGDLVKIGQQSLSRLKNLPVPTIAAIDGLCLGGGLELALACTYRVCSDSDKVMIGLPEVKLGIIPGFGGTQNLPRLIGIEKALGYILTGKSVNGKKALKDGIVDAMFSQAFFKEQVDTFSKTLLENPKALNTTHLPWRRTLLEGNPIGRAVLFRAAKKSVMKESKGHYPAPLVALDVIKKSATKPFKKGLDIEHLGFMKLVGTPESKNLVHVYYLLDHAKKIVKEIANSSKASLPKRSAVLGAGMMGAGIAWLMAYKVGNVRLKDINWSTLSRGLADIRQSFSYLKSKGKITQSQYDNFVHRVSGTTSYDGFDRAEIVIEAIAENIDIKQRVFKELEDNCSADTILASNTSSLSIDDIAAPLEHKNRVIGIHFFNPVNRMPLVEIIKGTHTSSNVAEKALMLIRQTGKHAIVVKNSPGFLINRILIPYVNEAAYLMMEGIDPIAIDRSMLQFGFPMGPITLMEQVGLDIGFHVAKIFQEQLGKTYQVPALWEYLMDHSNIRGKKSGHSLLGKNGRKTIHPDLINAIQENRISGGNANLSIEDIQDRFVMRLINEAGRCLDEGIVTSPNMLDFGMIFATGFPPFRGGLCRHADQLGLNHVVSKLNDYESTYGSRYQAAKALTSRLPTGKGFYT